MLRITRLTRQVGEQSIKLEGQLLEPWISTVREACASSERGSTNVRLDLAAVSYVDSAGFQLLCDLLREGVEIGSCSSFVRELLRRVQDGKPTRGSADEIAPIEKRSK